MKLSNLALASLLFSGNLLAENVVIVNSGNSSQVDAELVKKIYTGKIVEFPDGKMANAVNFAQSNPLRNSFDEKILERQTSQVQALWAKLVFTGKATPPKEVNSVEEVIAIVSSDTAAIGYIDASKVTDSVKVVAKF